MYNLLKTTLCLILLLVPISVSAIDGIVINTQAKWKTSDTANSIYGNLWKETQNAVIIDIGTGVSWNMQFTYGSNHADVETLTKDDTAKMYGVFNEEGKTEYQNRTSWNYRPVIVITNGVALAGSLHDVPHAGLDAYPGYPYKVANRSYGEKNPAYKAEGHNLDRIKGNGVDGVFCIHFDGSTSHNKGAITEIKQQLRVQQAVKSLNEGYLERLEGFNYVILENNEYSVVHSDLGTDYEEGLYDYYDLLTPEEKGMFESLDGTMFFAEHEQTIKELSSDLQFHSKNNILTNIRTAVIVLGLLLIGVSSIFLLFYCLDLTINTKLVYTLTFGNMLSTDYTLNLDPTKPVPKTVDINGQTVHLLTPLRFLLTFGSLLLIGLALVNGFFYTLIFFL